MDKLVIAGGARLTGEVEVSGAKNAALPILAASLLCNEKVNLKNLPQLCDITTMFKVLDILGVKSCETEEEISIHPEGIDNFEAPYDLVKQMRASILVLGPLLGRFGKARVSLPGGCAIGSRPIDLHLKGLERLGTEIRIEGGYIEAKATRLKGNEIYLDFPSVGATLNLIMAATLAEGETIIEEAAKEPEVVDLISFLNTMGAKIEGAGGDRLQITGVKELRGGTYKIIPDRIEAGTFMVAATITQGEILVKGANIEHLGAVVTKLEELGASIEKEADGICVASREIRHPIEIKTMPHPGFPTDMQAQFMALATITPGTSIITETIFENRFMHVSELNRMGADIIVEGNSAIIKGASRLFGASVMATDLRASAALVLAGLIAEGTTEVLRVYHLDRGYERIEEKLSRLGANIWRKKDE
ncbi:TPA: UDP-N-acetylglucosamine 1-carboxyvinyltransferase [bacterium]|nr:UDP-N-acetylglucosamine 1-carboxyvinyltransferase [bacterium]